MPSKIKIYTHGFKVKKKNNVKIFSMLGYFNFVVNTLKAYALVSIWNSKANVKPLQAFFTNCLFALPYF